MVKKIFNTYKIEIYKIGRLKSGKCFQALPCFNGPGKDYNFIKSPRSNLHYFLSDRISEKITPKKQEFGRLTIFVIKSMPTTNKYEPVFSNPKILQIPQIESIILGFSMYFNNVTNKIHLIFSANFKLYETTSVDGLKFSSPKLLLNLTGKHRDPTISRNGLILVFAEEKNNMEFVKVFVRDSIGKSFNNSIKLQVEESEQSKGDGLFPSIVEKKGSVFILYQINNKMFSAELKDKTIYPSVKVSGHLPSKYLTTFNNIYAGSYLPERNNFDLALYNIKIIKINVGKFVKTEIEK